MSFARAALLLAALVTVPGSARGEDRPATATATVRCERVAAPGRVKCAAEVRAAAGRSIAWADIVILELPDLATALKGRIADVDTTARDAGGQSWAFGLVARRAGQGDLRARVRALVCDAPAATDAARCAPVALDVRAAVQVG